MPVNINGSTGISGVDGSAGTPAIQGSDTNTGVFFGTNTIDFSTDGTSRLSIDSSGRVGIGTTSPSTKLQVDGSWVSNYGTLNIAGPDNDLMGVGFRNTSTYLGGVFFRDGTAGDFLELNAQGSRAIRALTNATERARIDSSGRLLVGTSSASISDKFIVYGNANNNDEAFATLSRGSAPADGQNLGVLAFSQNIDRIGARILAQRDGGTWTGGSSHPGRLVFSTTADGASSPTERMRIRSNGQTYWGSSAPGAASFGTSIGRSGLAGFVESYRNVNGTFAAVQFGGTAGYAQVMGDGDLENTNNRYTGLSDAKFKQNIEDATSQWDDIKSIQVRKYELIANPDRSHIGCVAQELELVCPGLVIERENLDGETYKSVAYSVLYMKAVKALQEAMERIETLETRLTALEGGTN